MKSDRILLVLIVVVLAAAAIVIGLKLRPAETPAPRVSVEPGSVSLLVIGVQGLEASIVDRLTEEGRLPNISALADRGATGEYSTLGRTVDPRIVWTSLVTGMAPENQGVGGLRLSRRGEMVPAPLIPQARTVGTVWTYLGERGETCGVVGWPGTWPVEEIEGVMVGPYSTYVLERNHGGDPVEAVSPVSEYPVIDPLVLDGSAFTRRDLSRFVDTDTRLGLEALVGQNYASLADAVAGDRSAVDVAEHMAASSGAQNLFVCLHGVDVVSQRFWHYADTEAIERLDVGEDERRTLEGQIEALGETIEKYYEFVDELVGELVVVAGEAATVAIITDHGYIGVPLDEAGMPKIGVHMHSEEGRFVLAGPRVRPGARAERGSLLDVAPTLMAAVALDVTAEFDGEVHDEILRR